MNVFVYPPSPSILWWMVWMTMMVTFLSSFSTSLSLPPRLPILPASIKFRDEGNHVIYDIERRFSPLSTIASNIGGLDIKSQLNNLYDKFQPLWGRKNNPNNIGSIISEITATQPGGSSSTTYTVPATGMTHVTSEGGDSSSSSVTSLPSVPSVSSSTSESSKETSSKVDERRSRYSYYHQDRDYWRPPRDRPYRRRRRPYRDRDPWKPYYPYGLPSSGDGYGTSPALYGIRVGESLKGHNNRIAATASSSSPSSSPSPPYPPYPPPPYPYPYPYPPGVPLPAVPPGFPPPYLPASSSHLHPLFAHPLSSPDSSTTTTTPKPPNVKKKKESIMPQTIINDDGTITISGIKPQAIVNGIAGVVKKTGLNKVIGSAISSVVHQVSSASSKVVKDVAQAVQVSVVDETPKGESNDEEQSEETEEDSSPPPRPSPPRLSSTKAILSLKDARISLKPTQNGLSIRFGRV